MDRRSNDGSCWSTVVSIKEWVNWVLIDADRLQTIGSSLNQDSAEFPELSFLGVADSIDGCTRWTLIQATNYRLKPSTAPLHFLKSWFLVYFLYGVLNLFIIVKQYLKINKGLVLFIFIIFVGTPSIHYIYCPWDKTKLYPNIKSIYEWSKEYNHWCLKDQFERSLSSLLQ